LNYARLMRGTYEGRQKALDWLQRPLDKSGMTRLRASLAGDYEIQMVIDATGLLMDQYQTETDEVKKAEFLKQVGEGVAKVDGKLGPDSPPTLTLKGRLLQLQGKTTEAIQVLEKAKAVLAQQNRPKDYELLFAMARAYASQNET